MQTIRDLATELIGDVRSPKLMSAVVMGLISSINLIVYCFSVGTPIFGGPLAPYAFSGVGLLLFGSLVGCLLTSLFSGYLGATVKPPLPALLVLGGIASALSLAGDPLFMTVAAIFGVSAVSTGICFLLMGRLRVTGMLRFVPYPVSGGFLAGTGGVLCLLALPLIGFDYDMRPLTGLIKPDVIANWGPGVAFGLGLFWAAKRWRADLIVPASVLAAALIFHLGLAAFAISPSEARADGLLLSVSGEGGMWPPFGLAGRG